MFAECSDWDTTSEFSTYHLCEQRRFRQASASVQSCQNFRCSLIQAASREEPSDRKPDPWPLWMAGHEQLKFVMTECSKTNSLDAPQLFYLPKLSVQEVWKVTTEASFSMQFPFITVNSLIFANIREVILHEFNILAKCLRIRKHHASRIWISVKKFQITKSPNKVHAKIKWFTVWFGLSALGSPQFTYRKLT